MGEIEIRAVRLSDAQAVADIYAYYVEHSTCTFDLHTPSRSKMKDKIIRIASHLPWFCAVENGTLLGFAFAGPHREKKAYQWCVETSVYVDHQARGKHIGPKLYEVLLNELGTLGVVHCYAGITLPNDRSIALHEKLGFRPFALYEKIGYKLGAWTDVEWWHKQLGELPDSPLAPIPWKGLRE